MGHISKNPLGFPNFLASPHLIYFSISFSLLPYFPIVVENNEIDSCSISYRVVLEVAGNSDAVILSGLEADTQYQVTVAALWGGHKYRSRPIVFRTLGELFFFHMLVFISF